MIAGDRSYYPDYLFNNGVGENETLKATLGTVLDQI